METSALAEDLRQEKNITYRYDTSGRWFKGSLHLHTVRSDGHLTLEKVAGKYAREQFDFKSLMPSEGAISTPPRIQNSSPSNMPATRSKWKPLRWSLFA